MTIVCFMIQLIEMTNFSQKEVGNITNDKCRLYRMLLFRSLPNYHCFKCGFDSGILILFFETSFSEILRNYINCPCWNSYWQIMSVCFEHFKSVSRHIYCKYKLNLIITTNITKIFFICHWNSDILLMLNNFGCHRLMM